jgi:dihydrofolate reductase
VSEQRASAVPGQASPIKLVLIAAVADNGVIGRGGDLPWRLKSDMQHFRAVTIGKPVVMGRKTFASIGKRLTGRTNIVVSRDPQFAAPGVLVAPSVDAALAAARGDALRRGADAVAVIGGADLYGQTIDRADRLVITHVHLQPDGETIFPTIESRVWKEAARTEHQPGPNDAAAFATVIYDRFKTDATRLTQPELTARCDIAGAL